MNVHYLEIVTLDINHVCKAYEETHDVKFGDPDELLGGAKTCVLNDGSIIGVRGPLRETEAPIVRPYWLVENIERATDNIKNLGAEIALPPMAIPGKGKFAIYILGGNEQGLWQL